MTSLLVPLSAVASDDAGRDRSPTPYPDTAAKFGGRGTEEAVIPPLDRMFIGYDGWIYTRAGWTVKGQHGTVYLGEEFDSACVTGDNFDDALDRIGTFVKMIRASGRRVIFTITPSKTAINKRDLPVAMPHGDCDVNGIRAQDQILDSYQDASFIPIRSTLERLTAQKVPVYWKLDSHWTTVASTMWGQTVAQHLDPRIAKFQRYKLSTRTHVPDIAYVIGQQGVYETEQARLTKTKVRTEFAPPGYHHVNLTGFDLNWTNRPKKKTWPGKTLLLGDSFTYLGMESLIPLFRNGRYMWIGHVDNSDIVDAVAESDTVIIEVAQRYVATSWLGDPGVQAQLALALAAAPRASG